MKITYTLLISLIFLAGNLKAQPQQWYEQVSGVTFQLTSVSRTQSISPLIAWICGYSGTVLRTSNAGQNWLNVSGGGIPNTVSLINIFAIDQNTAITAGYTGSNTWVWKTTNAGVNWVQVFTEQNGFIDAVWMTSNTSGFMVGDPVGGRWSLWKTSNGGTNWDSAGLYLPQAGSEAGYNNSLFISQNKIWFGTNNTRIYYSSNNGSNWTAQPTTGELNSYVIWFSGADGLAGCATLKQTSNNGTNWVTMPSLGTGNFSGITGTPAPVENPQGFGYLWYVRGNTNIYYSFGGSNWILEYTAPAGNYRHISQIYSFGGFWAVRSNGGISYHIPIVGINNISSEIPSDYKLLQNYPNPFNPKSNIKFQIAKLGLVKLVVFDALGQEISTLVNENLSPGTYEVEWDGTNYPSGVYFYKLVVSEAEPLTTENYTETRKMVLIK